MKTPRFSIGKNSENQPVDIDNLTQAQKEEISHLYVEGLKQIREQLKDNSKYLVASKENTGVTKEAISFASEKLKLIKNVVRVHLHTDTLRAELKT